MSQSGLPGMRRPILRDMRRYKHIYFMLLPILIYYALFHYLPMAGLSIAFKDYRVGQSLFAGRWVGLKHFDKFLNGPFAWRLIRNTLVLNLLQITFSFPAPVIFALMLHELKDNRYKRSLQTVSYMPHFISLVVVCGLLQEFSMTSGLFNDLRAALGQERVSLLTKAEWFRPLFIASDIWQGVGWGSIIYLATLTGVDPNLHEAAAIDGAGRLRRILHVNLPAIVPIIVVQLIMRLGNIMTVGFEKVFLLYSPVIYDTSDVISTYVYRRGLEFQEYSFGAAVGMFNSFVNLMVLFGANWLSRRVSENSLW